MSEVPYKCYRKTNLLSRLPAITNGRERFALGMAFQDIDSKARIKQLKKAVGHDNDSVVELSLDDVSDIDEMMTEAQLVTDLVRRPLKSNVHLAEDEAFALNEAANYCRQATIALNHAFRIICSGPMNRHHEQIRQRNKCTTTSTSGESDPEYR